MPRLEVLGLLKRLPRRAWLGPAIAYLAVIVAVFGSAGGPPTAEAAWLAVVPLVWLAFYGSRRELWLGLGAAAAAFLGPPLTEGAAVGRELLAVAAMTLVGVTVHALAGRLRGEEALTRAIVDGAQDAFVAIDGHGRITGWNRQAEATFGWPADEAVGRPLADTLIPERFRDAHRHGLERFLATGTGTVVGRRLELAALHRDGRELPIEMTISAVPRGDSHVFNAFLHDISDRKRAERYLAAQHAVSRVLAESSTVDEARPAILAALGESLGWVLGRYWSVRPGDAHIRCDVAWNAPGVEVPAFDVATATAAFAPGQGLPGRVWEAGVPAWVRDVGTDVNFPRAAAAARDGIRGAICLPVLSGRNVLGAIELFAREVRPPDPELLLLLADLGTQLGEFTERKRAEQRVMDDTRDMATVARATQALSQSTDPQVAREAICTAAREVGDAPVAILFEPDGADRLVSTAMSGVAVRELSTPTRDERSRLAAAFASGRPVVVVDALSDPAASSRLQALTGVRALLHQPVLSGGRAVGVLTIGWRTSPGELSDHLSAAAALLAAHAAAAIERADLLGRLASQARTDPLTALPNRRMWDEQLPRELARARRDGRPLTVALFDLDHFGAYNERHGHPGGDRLLRETTAAWAAVVRDADVLARCGGEEFGLLLPDCSAGNALPVVERAREVLPDGQTCSAGVAQWDGQESAEQLVARADAALYAAKAAGRDRARIAA